jgi:serine protease DegS
MQIARILSFVAQSIVIGLAVAFLVVLVQPSLLNDPGQEVGSYAPAVVASAPAIVNIHTAQILGQPLRRGQLSGTVPMVGTGLGSGVVVRADGYIVTNWHVVRDADQIRVQLADGRVVAPTLVGADPETELALLKVDLQDLPTISLGRSDTLRIGDVVLAIGNSFGLSQTVTQGIVSATGRGQLGVALFENFIQTDAAINIGNSGGALVNTRGELVGINTAVVNAAAANREVIPDGIGFAIPVNLVRGVMDELIANGRVIRGWLGVEPINLTPELAKRLGTESGVVLAAIPPGPAAVAGLQAGDVLTAIDGQPVSSARQAMNRVAGGKPGDQITLTVWRVDRSFETTATLEERPPSPQ